MSIEKIREWNPRSTLAVHYKDPANPQAPKLLWKTNQAQLLEEIQKIIQALSKLRIKPTNRQIYYKLVKANTIPNAIEVDRRLNVFLTDARYGGEIDWDAIEDRGRVPEMHGEWENVSALVDSAVAAYRLPRWKNQEYYVELVWEKDAITSTLMPIANEFHVYGSYNKGYTSFASMRNLAQRFKAKIKEGKKGVVLYVGDHDPSGIDMERDIRERVLEFLTHGNDPVKPRFVVEKLALTIQQVKQFNLPPNPAKLKDTRAKKYIKKFGNVSWELEALETPMLLTLVRNGVLKYLDKAKYDAVVEREKQEITALEDFAETLT